MKVLIVGKGGREHAFLRAVRKSKLVDEVFVLPGNCMMKDCKLVDIDMYDVKAVCDFALKEKIDLTIVGPCDVLALGIKDEFEKHNLKLFGPTKSATRIESSRYFAKQLMEKLKIPTTDYAVFTDRDQAIKYVSSLEKFPVMIKLDGFSKKFSVNISKSNESAIDTINLIFDENENAKVIIEEYVLGKEFSIFALVKDDKVFYLQTVKDYKRLLDGDLGPYTGGMGAVSPVFNVTDFEIDYVVEKILKPMARSMYEAGYGFEGFLYGEIVVSNEIKVLGFNARLGEPETEVLLPRLKSDFVENILDIMNGKEPSLQWSDESCVGVVLASKGYMEDELLQDKLNIVPTESEVCFMGVKKEKKLVYADGTRNLIVIAKDKNIEDAREKVYRDVEKLKTDSLIYRTDIGKF